MLRRIFSKSPGPDSEKSNARQEAEKCMTEVEKLFAIAASITQDITERMSALNQAARLGRTHLQEAVRQDWASGNKLKAFVDTMEETDEAKVVWQEQSNEVQRQLQILTERMCSADAPREPPQPPPPAPMEFDLFSGLTLESSRETQQETQQKVEKLSPAPSQETTASTRRPLDEDMFSELIPLDAALAPSTDKSSGIWPVSTEEERHAFFDAEATFSEVSPRSMDAPSVGGSSSMRGRSTKKIKMQVGLGRGPKKPSTAQADILKLDAELQTPIPSQPAMQKDAGVDLLSEDSAPCLPQASMANGRKEDREVPKSESPEEKVARLRQEATEELEMLQSKELHSKQDLVALLHRLQSQWASDEVCEADDLSMHADPHLMKLVDQEQSFLKQMEQHLSKTSELLSDVKVRHQEDTQATQEKLEEAERGLEEKMHQGRGDLEEAKEAADSKRRAYEQAKKEVEERCHESRTQKEAELDDRIHQSEKLQQEIEQLKAALQEKETALEAIQVEIHGISEALEKIKDEIPDDSDLQDDVERLKLLEDEMAEKEAELEKHQVAKKAFEDKIESENASLETSLTTMVDTLAETQRTAHIMDVLKKLFSEMQKAWDAALQRFSSLKAEQDGKKRQRDTLVETKAALDEDLASMNAQVQDKEEELQQIMSAKRAALDAKEYSEAAQLAERIKTVTFDLSELESRRLSSCQEAETLEKQLLDLPQSTSASDEEALESSQTAMHECQYRLLFLFQQILRRLAEDEGEDDGHVLAALSALEERHGWNATVLCKDVIDCLGDAL